MERGGGNDVCGVRTVFTHSWCKLCIITFLLFSTSYVFSAVGPENVLILVNENSPTSVYIAKLYRQFYPDIGDDQVLFLSGLTDCSGPNSGPEQEILTRTTYEECIAGPVQDYLLANPELFEQVMVLITTAGMPYRIEDTNPAFGNVIMPAGSSGTTVMDHEDDIDAASVESELSCLWILGDGPSMAEKQNRIVNPYHGCISSFSQFERDIPAPSQFTWSLAWSKMPGVADPLMEGNAYGYGTANRQFGPGYMYLVCRLDGPKKQRQSGVFAVRKLLERSSRASAASSGVDPNQAVIVLDDAPRSSSGNIDYNRVFNLHEEYVDFWQYTEGQTGPPDAYGLRYSDDYIEAFYNLLNGNPMQNIGDLYFGTSAVIHGIPALEDYRDYQCTAYYGFDFLNDYYPNRQQSQGVAALCCFGKNGDEGRNKYYLLSGGPGGTPLYHLLNGAVFTSLESYNGLTMFSDASTSQAKIIDFIEIGGSGAIGHSFEPQADAAIDNEFFLYNVFADHDHDGKADMTFVEAAFTGIPYLSWSEIVIGDPLMRIAYGPGEDTSWEQTEGDVNQDGYVNIRDMVCLRNLIYLSGNPSLNSSIPAKREAYKDLCDLDQDGYNNIRDLVILRNLLYSY